MVRLNQQNVEETYIQRVQSAESLLTTLTNICLCLGGMECLMTSSGGDEKF